MWCCNAFGGVRDGVVERARLKERVTERERKTKKEKVRVRKKDREKEMSFGSFWRTFSEGIVVWGWLGEGGLFVCDNKKGLWVTHSTSCNPCDWFGTSANQGHDLERRDYRRGRCVVLFCNTSYPIVRYFSTVIDSGCSPLWIHANSSSNASNQRYQDVPHWTEWRSFKSIRLSNWLIHVGVKLWTHCNYRGRIRIKCCYLNDFWQCGV